MWQIVVHAASVAHCVCCLLCSFLGVHFLVSDQWCNQLVAPTGTFPSSMCATVPASQPASTMSVRITRNVSAASRLASSLLVSTPRPVFVGVGSTCVGISVELSSLSHWRELRMHLLSSATNSRLLFSFGNGSTGEASSLFLWLGFLPFIPSLLELLSEHLHGLLWGSQLLLCFRWLPPLSGSSSSLHLSSQLRAPPQQILPSSAGLCLSGLGAAFLAVPLTRRGQVPLGASEAPPLSCRSNLTYRAQNVVAFHVRFRSMRRCLDASRCCLSPRSRHHHQLITADRSAHTTRCTVTHTQCRLQWLDLKDCSRTNGLALGKAGPGARVPKHTAALLCAVLCYCVLNGTSKTTNADTSPPASLGFAHAARTRAGFKQQRGFSTPRVSLTLARLPTCVGVEAQRQQAFCAE